MIKEMIVTLMFKASICLNILLIYIIVVLACRLVLKRKKLTHKQRAVIIIVGITLAAVGGHLIKNGISKTQKLKMYIATDPAVLLYNSEPVGILPANTRYAFSGNPGKEIKRFAVYLDFYFLGHEKEIKSRFIECDSNQIRQESISQALIFEPTDEIIEKMLKKYKKKKAKIDQVKDSEAEPGE